jgi:hypothetical protein
MAAALMTQWLFNFVIAKLTPIMLANITYGTFLVFGSACIVMVVYAILCIPETKGKTPFTEKTIVRRVRTNSILQVYRSSPSTFSSRATSSPVPLAIPFLASPALSTCRKVVMASRMSSTTMRRVRLARSTV